MKRVVLSITVLLLGAAATPAQDSYVRQFECEVKLFRTDAKGETKYLAGTGEAVAVFQVPEGRRFSLNLVDPKASFQGVCWRFPGGEILLRAEWKMLYLDLANPLQPLQEDLFVSTSETLKPETPVKLTLARTPRGEQYYAQVTVKPLQNLLDRHPGLVEDFMLSLRSGVPQVREKATLALFDLGREALSTLIEAIESKDSVLQRAGCNILAELVRRRTNLIGYEDKIIEKLREAIRSEDPAIHQAAAEALAVVVMGEVGGIPNTQVGATYRVTK